MKRSLKIRLAKLEDALIRKRQTNLIKVLFIPKACSDLKAFYAQCEAETPEGRRPFYIDFIGPEGGPELGSGPIESDSNEI